ncbi:metal ABC transporter solute-binding protein, Zn/Mn family [Nesterenkonia flava]|uniref:Zinc ABC transporter substrate-binding protein n=1 Tax=Nesterenkonia flava TaxID=469799 RepID=A0ABU1FSL6_9MICC|nr:zinc ABC transporter substrate-binding protein [Nesterenkonia flava]MDR5711651.1 zinc ABC transporter substrate-binding protein [Nesterenkonia flava]
MPKSRFETPTKLSAAALASALASAALVLTGCGSEPRENDKPVVLTTFTVLQDMVAEVGGDRVEVHSITPAGAEVHEYDPTPGDIRHAVEADLVIENGLGLEEWFEQFISQSEAPSVTVTDGVDTLPVTRLPGHPDDTGAEMPVNPHAWMSPTAALTYIDNIEAALADLSPQDAEAFAANAENYRERIRALDQQTRERVDQLEGETHLVTCEGAFSYLAEDYGFGEHYLWPLNAEDEGTPAQVEAQIRYVSDHEVPTVFCESTVNDSAQQRVAEATGAQLGDPLYVDSLSEGEGPVSSFEDMLTYNIDLILDGAERG